jgi:hypothetical protein
MNPHKIRERALEKSFDSMYDALSGSAPAAVAAPGCDGAALPVCNRGKMFSSAHARALQYATPKGGRAGAGEETIMGKEDFPGAKESKPSDNRVRIFFNHP